MVRGVNVPKVSHNEVTELLDEDDMVAEYVESIGGMVELDEKEHENLAVYVASKKLPEGVTVKHSYLDHMKRKGY